jgi:serine/threonine protein kinase
VTQIDHNGVVKLCDFGLARVIGKEPSQRCVECMVHGVFSIRDGILIHPPYTREYSSENSRAGTPVYLAPEALQGAATTHKVDIYSFSIILWEMMTGQQAWVSLDYKQMVAAVVRDRKR